MPPYFATNLYPKVLYSTSRTVEAEMPVTAFGPVFEEVRQETFAATGKRYVTVYRREERAHVQFMGVDGYEVQRWREFMQDHGLRGKQFELLVDRFMGAVFTFPNTAVDQNYNTTSWSLTYSYAIANSRWGLVLAGSGTLTIANQFGSLNAPLVNSGGVIVMTFVPNFPYNTGSEYIIFACGSAGATQNVLLIETLGSGQMDFTVRWASGSYFTLRWASASWTQNVTQLTLIARFHQTQTPAFWFITDSPPFVGQATLQADFANLGSLTTLANTITIHSDASAGSRFVPMTLLHLGLYKLDYADPTILSSYFPVGRNYYDKAEVLDALFQPQRAAPTVDLWNMSFLIREGV